MADTTPVNNDRIVHLQLPALFVGQLLDGLDVLIEQWIATEEYHESGLCSDIGIRECTDAHEARSIREFYERIRAAIREQVESVRD